MLYHYAPNCPVFIFQSIEKLSDDDNKYIKNESNLFIQDWFSHEDKIDSNILICHHHFVIVVILNLSSVSGCGKDRLTNHLKSIGSIIGKNFFNTKYQKTYRYFFIISILLLLYQYLIPIIYSDSELKHLFFLI